MVCAPIMAAVSLGVKPKLLRKKARMSSVSMLGEQTSGFGPSVMWAALQGCRPIVVNGMGRKAVSGMAISTPTKLASAQMSGRESPCGS